MLKKLHILILLAILALLGATQKQTIQPNQEIVLRFPDTVEDSANEQRAILEVKEHLCAIGAKNVRFLQNDDGQLKITYYSSLDVNLIKQLLIQKERSTLDFADNSNSSSNTPQNEKPDNQYDFDVKEISGFPDSGFEGKASLLAELKLDKPRSFGPNSFILLNTLEVKEQANFEKRLKIFGNVVLSKNNFSFQIPEVRAGPYC